MIKEPPILRIRRNPPRPTNAQIAAFQDVPTGFVVDALGGTGALDVAIAPLGAGRDLPCTAAGPALTADNGPADILAFFAAQCRVQTGDIVVSANSGHRGAAGAGDRVAAMLKNAGASGLVTDAPVRDYSGLVQVGLPVWCNGLTPATPFSKGPGSVGFALQIGGQRVDSGDMIVADRDGVVVVPFERIDEVISKLADIKKLEDELDAMVAAGQRSFPWVEELLQSDAVEYVD